MAQYHDLSDLKKLSHDLKVQAKAAQEAKRVQAAKANRLGAEAAAFREAMASLGVKNEDHTRGRRITTPAKPAPVPHQSKLEKRRFSKNPSQTSAIQWCFLRATTA